MQSIQLHNGAYSVVKIDDALTSVLTDVVHHQVIEEYHSMMSHRL